MVTGFTGHQDLGSVATCAWVRKQIKSAALNHQVDLGVMSLAIGADQLFAAVLAELKINFEVVVPCRRYEETFDRAALSRYRHFLALATKMYVLDFDEPSERAYYEAGKVIVNRSALIIAVWNGKPAKGLGGTADVVRYAQQKSKVVIHIDPEQHRVVII